MTSTQGNLFEIRENIRYCERLWLEQRLLTVLGILPCNVKRRILCKMIEWTDHGYKTKITLFLQVGFDRCKTPTSRFTNSLDKQTFPDT